MYFRLSNASIKAVIMRDFDLLKIIRLYEKDSQLIWAVIESKHDCFPLSEPVASVAPKITFGGDFNRLKVAQRKSIALLCPAQSSPIAAFR